MSGVAHKTGVARRYWLQEIAAWLLPAERVARCHVSIIPGRQFVAVYVSRDGRASYGNLFTYGSLWRCAVCASRLSEVRRAELSAALMAGCRHVLVTYTLQHKIGDLLPRLPRAALYGVTSRSVLAGLVACVGSLEVTYGANGWHPHLHELVFFEGAVDLSDIVGFLRSRWLDALNVSGFTASWLHGLDARYASDQIAAYVAKWGHDPKWSAAHEVTKHVVKRGRGSLTPSDLLALAPSDARAASLWMEYAAAMHGLHHLQWSRGLRAKLGLPASERFDVGGVPPEVAAAVPSPSPAAPAPSSEYPARSPLFTTFEFTSIRISDRGEPRALSTSGKYARFGFPLAAILDEYLKRAELSADVVANLPSGTLLPHKVVRLRVDPNGVVTFVD